MRWGKRFGGGIVLAAILLSAIIVLQAGMARAQQSGIGVDNDGPSFTDISIAETDQVTYVNVDVRDLNGCLDIFSINVTIFDNQNRPIARVNYMQYANLQATVAAITWDEEVGDYFDRTLSTWEHIPVAPWNPDFSPTPIGLRVSFAFNKFSGDHVNILALDKGELFCEYNGPFSAEYTPAPMFKEVVVPIGLSTVTAFGVAGFMVYRRFQNNKLAKAVEARHATAGEE